MLFCSGWQIVPAMLDTLPGPVSIDHICKLLSISLSVMNAFCCLSGYQYIPQSRQVFGRLQWLKGAYLCSYVCALHRCSTLHAHYRMPGAQMRLTLETLLLLHQASLRRLQLREKQAEAMASVLSTQEKGHLNLKQPGIVSDRPETQQADLLEMSRHAVPEDRQGMLAATGLQEQAEAVNRKGPIKVFTVHRPIKEVLTRSGMNFDHSVQSCS